MLGFYDYTVILTYLSVAASIVGICFASQEEYLGAVVCLLFSGVCDMFDGMVARTKKNRTEAEKKNGIQLDSLADVICFGAFPAVLGYTLAAGTKYWYFSAGVGVIFVLAAVTRLAYFNVTEELRQQETTEKRKSYEGLPVTTVALIIPALFCFRGLLGEYFTLCYSIALLLTAACFVIKPLKIKKIGRTGSIVLVVVGIMLFAVLLALKLQGF